MTLRYGGGIPGSHGPAIAGETSLESGGARREIQVASEDKTTIHTAGEGGVQHGQD